MKNRVKNVLRKPEFFQLQVAIKRLCGKIIDQS